MTDPVVISLMGPTASGKTALALELVQSLPCDIISVDSALIYKGMDIGTAKPDAAELAIAPHRLIDIKDPADSYSVAEFRRDALTHIDDIIARGRIPLLVGGTMMYFKVLMEGMSPLPEAAPGIRRRIEQQVEQQGWQAVHDELKAIDPVSAERIHPNDPQRLMRAIEVYRITGQSMTELTRQKLPALSYPTLQLAIAPGERAVLHQRIEQRFDLMLEQGFEQEVAALYKRPDLHLNLPSIRCVGYRQMWEYLDGKLDYEQMRFKGIVATRQLAKRQFTWLRGWSDVQWLDTFASNNLDTVLSMLEGFSKRTT